MAKVGFTVVGMENNTIIINNNNRINSVFYLLTAVNLLLPHPVLTIGTTGSHRSSKNAYPI